ncbi:MAG: flagellar biosynthetic protein FliQ [Candidatus Rokubacteria bacterium]|jgi:flagellar biosynthetic protein FliQ|nr:flagellar biosynthetic protein FliQ [Candidatus Rokubacteria bacterium]GIU85821.1 MAG: flagellar biosynthetic protein FliQ [Acidimicrobiia bacterium]
MTDGTVVEIAVQAILLTTKLAAPILLVTLGIGVGIGLIQSATQVQEQTLTFVPKLAGVALVILLGGHWMIAEFTGFTNNLFDQIPSLIRT